MGLKWIFRRYHPLLVPVLTRYCAIFLVILIGSGSGVVPIAPFGRYSGLLQPFRSQRSSYFSTEQSPSFLLVRRADANETGSGHIF